MKERGTKIRHFAYIYKMRLFIFSSLLSVLFLQSFSQTAETEIKALMRVQEQSWNAGDLEGFMAAYWHSDSLQFVVSKGITYGWTATLNNYRKNYDTPEKMGRLEFKILSFELLSEDTAFLIGSWALFREKPVGGYFSLLWKKQAGQWRIVCDHTS